MNGEELWDWLTPEYAVQFFIYGMITVVLIEVIVIVYLEYQKWSNLIYQNKKGDTKEKEKEKEVIS